MSLAPHFLNVDLEIRSLTDPATLIAEVWDRVIVLHCGPQKPGYLCVLELSKEFPDPDGTILEYCRLIEGLSPDGRRLWDALDFKEFDIGYDRSPDQHCSRFSLWQETVNGIGATGASMALSMYRHDTESAPPGVGSAGAPRAPVS